MLIKKISKRLINELRNNYFKIGDYIYGELTKFWKITRITFSTSKFLWIKTVIFRYDSESDSLVEEATNPGLMTVYVSGDITAKSLFESWLKFSSKAITKEDELLKILRQKKKITTENTVPSPIKSRISNFFKKLKC